MARRGEELQISGIGFRLLICNNDSSWLEMSIAFGALTLHAALVVGCLDIY